MNLLKSLILTHIYMCQRIPSHWLEIIHPGIPLQILPFCPKWLSLLAYLPIVNLCRLLIGDCRILNSDLHLEFFNLQIRKWCNFLSHWFCNFFIILRTNRWESPAPWDPLYKAYIVNSPLEKVRVLLWVFGMKFLLHILAIVTTALTLLPLHTIWYMIPLPPFSHELLLIRSPLQLLKWLHRICFEVSTMINYATGISCACLSVSLSVCLSASVYVCLCVSSVCQSFFVSVCVRVWLPSCLICLSVYLSVSVSICLHVSSACLSIFMSHCLSVCLFCR